MSRTSKIDDFVADEEAKALRMAEMQHKYALAKAKYAYKSERMEPLAVIVGIFLAGVLILAIAALIWRANAGLSASEQMELQQSKDCMEAGGTWVPNIGDYVDICFLNVAPREIPDVP